jgi:hypothetical protein
MWPAVSVCLCHTHMCIFRSDMSDVGNKLCAGVDKVDGESCAPVADSHPSSVCVPQNLVYLKIRGHRYVQASTSAASR